ncbi:hypothetical protein DPEC_G00142030 [Dallia pectoralis]|uniref:Uncharacterized protein n=1 Tax=Dallia pectoralis TaxID=75939 RepID=A0ACC2GN58_DALPE|nr:hypothetical protein DPEC_G00142030 [Dallia pectoralis]
MNNSSLFSLIVLFLLVSLGITLNCNVTIHPNRTATYQLSEAPPSDGCETQWMYQNGSTLAYKKDADLDLVLVLTNQSIMTGFYLGLLKYAIDCAQPKLLNEVECYCRLNSCDLSSRPAHIESLAQSNKRSYMATCVVLGCFVVILTVILYAVVKSGMAGRYVVKKCDLGNCNTTV